MKTMCPACKGKGDIDRERATPQPPMSIEICIHGTDITNKLGIACLEGCLSNAQRGIENRQLAAELQRLKDKEECEAAQHRRNMERD